jgi:putative transposase
MLRFRRMKTLQKFSSVHAAFHNHFNQDRHLISRRDVSARSAPCSGAGSVVCA